MAVENTSSGIRDCEAFPNGLVVYRFIGVERVVGGFHASQGAYPRRNLSSSTETGK